MLGEILRNTQHVLWGPCKDVSILTEEIDEIAFLFTVKVCTHDSVPLWVLRVQGYLLCLFGRLERTLSLRLFWVGRYLRLLAGHRHNSLKEPLLGRDYQGLGQPTALCCGRRRLPATVKIPLELGIFILR